jgi:hypothetical protein
MNRFRCEDEDDALHLAGGISREIAEVKVESILETASLTRIAQRADRIAQWARKELKNRSAA